MNGIDLFVDTNVLINLAEGKSGVDQYLESNNLFVSIISEIELLGWHKITSPQKNYFKNMLSDCSIIGITNPVKELSIQLRQKHKVKLPDAIIAASAMHLDIPLLTFDKGFEQFKDLDLIVIY
ncbi:MAG TPA: type II toxin-antitoxin system VapC family toxin [Cyclobacteriaceae bacterium]|nr:type II toxin-antitoxin system VapC family toxin [Cyclobacteriaceae bacterium]HMV11030.1 type II toxin-antitoxin system VapC family toxin [Cyclobacteriaceae bacterium]HMV88629.1 type II toxin-antitoxin system VapC family toxin [Cyclobacteriaceae bacterium]HMX00609.1 type II toxin-antitoxin system VapC family toxin [Cyclobacteriaceae bacterium]HMX49516.1 type II toxin-antitoxin system VapC family toxin [Cyclobacteriaceae bacterium]